MPIESVLAMFLIGAVGGGHCIAMCGAVLTATRIASTPVLTAGYHSGRIMSYAIAGAVAGGLGSFAFLANDVLPVQRVLHGVASLMLLGLGLYLIGITRFIAPLERAGARLWKHIAPYAMRRLPARSFVDALALGALWGWLPCGLVYSVLASAAAAGSATVGALTMVAFGAGTLPGLLGAGTLLGKLSSRCSKSAARYIAGGLITLFALASLVHRAHAEALHTPMIDNAGHARVSEPAVLRIPTSSSSTVVLCVARG
jgi:uncharacterized protein